MRWLDAWPAVVIFLLFAWCELIWDGSDEPRSLALALLGYSALTWAGMLLFGRPQWLQRGEIFSVAFGLFGRFAPLETVDEGKGARLVLRPYAAGLLSREPESPALTCFVLLLLATVTFDGILETPAWAALAAWFEPRGLDSATLATLGLVGLPLAYVAIYLVTIGLTLRFVRASKSVGELAGWFITTFIPIAIAYNVAHNLSFRARDPIHDPDPFRPPGHRLGSLRHEALFNQDRLGKPLDGVHKGGRIGEVRFAKLLGPFEVRVQHA